MKRVMFIIAVSAASAMLDACGSGGGGNPPPPPPETRSVNVLSGTFGSRNSKSLQFSWIGDKTGINYGKVIVETATLVSGSGSVAVLADGTVQVNNDLARDTITFNFTTTHPSGTGDPQAGQPISGRTVLTIVPEDARLDPSKQNPFTIPQGGSVVLAVQAQNSRAAPSIVVLGSSHLPTATRNFVYTSATWEVTPTGAGTFANNADGTVTFTGASGFAGAVTITASIPDAFGGPFRATVTGNLIAHPTIGVSAPTEGQTVAGTINVQFTATNAAKVTYQVGNDTPVDVSGTSSFPLDTTKYANGPLAVTFKAIGQLETATLVRNVVVNNQAPPPPTPMKLVLSDKPPVTGQDLPLWTGRLSNGNYVSFGGGALIISAADGSGAIVKQYDGVTGSDTCPSLTSDDKVVVADPMGSVAVVDTTDPNATPRRVYLGAGFAYQASAVPGTTKALVATQTAVVQIDLVNLTAQTLFNVRCSAICGDGNHIWLVDQTGALPQLAQYDLLGNRVRSLTGGPSAGIAQLFYSKKSSIVVAVGGGQIVQWDAETGQLINQALPPPAGFQWRGIGPDNFTASPEQMLDQPDGDSRKDRRIYTFQFVPR